MSIEIKSIFDAKNHMINQGVVPAEKRNDMEVQSFYRYFIVTLPNGRSYDVDNDGEITKREAK